MKKKPIDQTEMMNEDMLREEVKRLQGQYDEVISSELSKPANQKIVTKVVVRWWDGYLERFNCTEARFGSDLLWLKLVGSKNRHIPLRQVRWYSVTPGSHE